MPQPDADPTQQAVDQAAFCMSECDLDPDARGTMPEILRKRADFLAAARARRQGMPGFLLQARDRGDNAPARIGYTCSKKIGNAVARNRAKRRLRAIARDALPGAARTGWDYVLVGRPGATSTRDYAALAADLAQALRRVHG